jgi:hypothetical protein
MIHLMAARLVAPDAGPLFYIGSTAPDTVTGRHEKDALHFRDLKDRQPALTALAKNTKGEFAEGILLHLYADWKWDTTILQGYIRKMGEDWFSSYRGELSIAGSHAFHSTPWAERVWAAMDAADPGAYGESPHAVKENIKGFIGRNYIWHRENRLGPSIFFPPDMIEDFVCKTAKEYIQWRNKHGYNERP